MKKKKSIKSLLLLPVIILGILSIFSNVMNLQNIKKVNSSSTTISGEYMPSLIKLSNIKEEFQNIHTLCLSHIIATDITDMITDISLIKEKEKKLDSELLSYQAKLSGDDATNFKKLLADYSDFKDAVANVCARSANGNTKDAHKLANTTVAGKMNAMISVINKIESNAMKSTDAEKSHLSVIYNASVISVISCIVIGIIIMLLSLYIVIKMVSKPITTAEKELNSVITSIDEKNGDLTKRIPVFRNDEIAALGNGINVFIKKLQSILGMIQRNSKQMDVVAGDVLNTVEKSNQSVTDLSALTEELTSTMELVHENTVTINENIDSVNADVNSMAKRTIEVDDYSKNMQKHAISMGERARENMNTVNEKVSQILSILNQAIEDSKSVNQVNSLSDDILSIASQTNLLALNASIEAARAGEAGKGFAVVATEISDLAEASKTSANNIQKINNVVVEAVGNLSEYAKDLVDYMTESILPEFDYYVKSGSEYMKNASYIKDVMDEFTQKTDTLENAISEIASSISSISISINEGTVGISDAAQDMQLLVNDMEVIAGKMEENKKLTTELMKETAIFTKL